MQDNEPTVNEGGKTKHNWLSGLPRITEQGQCLGPVEGTYKGKQVFAFLYHWIFGDRVAEGNIKEELLQAQSSVQGVPQAEVLRYLPGRFPKDILLYLCLRQYY